MHKDTSLTRKQTNINLSIEQFNFLHNHFNYSFQFVGESNANSSNFSALYAFGATKIIQPKSNSLQALQNSLDLSNDWHFGVLSYDLKNELFPIQSENKATIATPNLLFVIPRFVITQKADQQTLHCLTDNDFDFLQELLAQLPKQQAKKQSKIELQPQVSYAQYAEQFARIQEHIQLGNLYEMNYCFESVAKTVSLHPEVIFSRMREKALAPFMALVKAKHLQLVSASPERYLMRQDNTLYSQPIKGTAKRGNTKQEDEAIQQALLSSLKERTENVMIVDLVRNDLGRCCQAGTVEVTELQQIYSFPTVHQLISTIKGELKPNTSFKDIIESTFPMGSMTGAPKLKVLQVTEEVENFKRGWYSGAVGYIAPNGNFDFNVVIRSLLYDEELKRVSYGAGSGITAASVAKEEYNECLLKQQSLLSLIQ